jgi:hypothetical protein
VNGDERRWLGWLGYLLQDHRHRLRTVRAYAYRDAATLLADFWQTVDAVLREKGVIA